MTYTIDEKKVIYADLDPKEGIVLNVETKNYYRLNETGQLIWQGVAAGKDAEQIAASISASYNVPANDALEDVTSLIEAMKRERLIGIPSTTSPLFSVQEARTSKKNAR